jgi:hypothetical protein
VKRAYNCSWRLNLVTGAPRKKFNQRDNSALSPAVHLIMQISISDMICSGGITKGDDAPTTRQAFYE